MELVMKIKQLGEKPCWLVNPGMALNYTWDNSVSQQCQVQWMVYGSEEEAVTLKTSPGKVLWGEEKVIHRVVRNRRSQTSSSDTESDDDEDGSLAKTSIRSSASQNQIHPQNVVYKTKKSVYWISRGQEGKEHFTVYFYTSRKAAAGQLSSLLGQPARSLLVSCQSLRLSLISSGRQVGAVLLESPGVQWFLLVHGSWRCLGAEVAALIETARHRGENSLLLPGFIKLDLKQMTSTSPFFAPLKRVQLPAVTSLVKLRYSATTVKLAVARLRLETSSGLALSLIKPFLQLKKLHDQEWNCLDTVDLSVARVNLDFENLQNLGSLVKLATRNNPTGAKTFSIRTLRVSSMQVHVLGVDARLPEVIKDSFRDFKNFRTGSLTTSLEKMPGSQLVSLLTRAFLSYEKVDKQEQSCQRQEVYFTKTSLAKH